MLHINEVDDPSDTSASGSDTNDTEAMSVKALLRMSRILTPWREVANHSVPSLRIYMECIDPAPMERGSAGS